MNLENDFDEEQKDYSDVFQEGVDARKDLLRLMDCPHTDNNLRRYWMMGWCDQDMVIISEEEWVEND